MTKNLKKLVTENITPEDLDLDGGIAAVTEPQPEEEERFFPLLGIRCKVSEGDRLLAEKQAPYTL